MTVERVDITTDDVNKVAAWDIDVLVNNAGAGQTGPMADVPIDRVRRLFDVNVFGTLAVTQQVLKGMVAKGSGRVIIMSSIAGVMAGPTFGPYAMTKHALEAMGKAMRSELAPLGIDVTLLNPGPYQTGFNDRMADSMWEWFGDASLNAPAAPMFKMIGEMVTGAQLDPAEVVQRIVELTEADTHDREQLRATRHRGTAHQSPERLIHDDAASRTTELRPNRRRDGGGRERRTCSPRSRTAVSAACAHVCDGATGSVVVDGKWPLEPDLH